MPDDEKTIEMVARECGVNLPDKSKYDYALHTCYICKKQMIVFSWIDSEIWDKNEPSAPIPKTVQKRFTKTSGNSYWANVCPFCDSVQGDWYLNMEPGGVFSGIPDYDDFEDTHGKQVIDDAEEKIPEQQNLF
jgi:hypothetical protein